MGSDDFVYRLLYLLHVGAVVVGFGSNFVVSYLAARARDAAPADRRVLAHAAFGASKALTNGPIVATGVFGVFLVILSNEAYKFSQTWISIAFLLYFAVVALVLFLIAPNARAMDELGAKLAAGSVTTSKSGGPPREAVELEERGKKAAAFTGVVHLLWVLLMIDMVWKPGF